MSSIASSTDANSLIAPQPLDVLREDVDLEVDRVAGLERAERRHLERVRDERDREASVVERRDGERCARRPRSSPSRRSSGLSPAGRRTTSQLAARSREAADAVDVALDDVAAERVARAERRLDVHLVARGEATERRAVERLGDDVEGERAVLPAGDGEADAGDRDRIADRRRSVPVSTTSRAPSKARRFRPP